VFTITPNPSNGTIEIYYDATNFEKLFFNIYDISGRAFIKFELNPLQNFTFLNLTNLQVGIYFCFLKC
jgi:hypothetical protein